MFGIVRLLASGGRRGWLLPTREARNPDHGLFRDAHAFRRYFVHLVVVPLQQVVLHSVPIRSRDLLFNEPPTTEIYVAEGIFMGATVAHIATVIRVDHRPHSNGRI